MDTLSEVLKQISFQGQFYCTTEFRAPWGLLMPDALQHAAFVLVLRGSCLVTIPETGKTISMAAGELLLFPSGTGFVMQDDEKSAVVDIPSGLRQTS